MMTEITVTFKLSTRKNKSYKYSDKNFEIINVIKNNF